MDINTSSQHNVNTIQRFDIAVLPWGATEPHNLHLPYGTDTILAHRFSIEASQWAQQKWGINAAVLPPIPLGSQNPGQRDVIFCLHTRYETQKAILADIIESLSHQGLNKLVIVNGHGGNSFKNMLRDLALDYPDFTVVQCDWFAIVRQPDFFEHTDDHAGEMETSVMMHFHPELVDISTAGDGKGKPFALSTLKNKIGWLPRNWNKVTQDTGIGYPKAATPQKGEKCALWATEQIATLLYEVSTQELY